MTPLKYKMFILNYNNVSQLFIYLFIYLCLNKCNLGETFKNIKIVLNPNFLQSGAHVIDFYMSKFYHIYTILVYHNYTILDTQHSMLYLMA